MNYGAIILAAGKGTRMNSKIPKVLHPVGGKPIIKHIVDTTLNLGIEKPIIVCAHDAEKLQKSLDGYNITWVKQSEQLGTGHAVLQTLDYLSDKKTYIILVGDIPLIKKNSLEKLANSSKKTGIAVLTVNLKKPFGYGRIIRHKKGYVSKIVEQIDTNEEQNAIREVNTGVFAIRGDILKSLLGKIDNNNNQKEYYLTDIVEIANEHEHYVNAHASNDNYEILGCNDKCQLSKLERIYQKNNAYSLMKKGTTIIDSNRIDIRGNLTTGKDCFIDINCIFEGNVELGENVIIEANCIIKNSIISDNTIIKSHTVIESSKIGKHVEIGPFARIRPKTNLNNNTKIGNFVETKNSTIRKETKINHLSYIGDAEIGESVNIGAGTITCNYDGTNKHQTTIGSNSFIGSNSSLIAPINIGENVTVAAGSNVNKKIEKDSLVIARSKQKIITGWKRSKKINHKK